MEQNQLVIIAAIIIALLIIKGFINNNRKPKNSTFKCARCKTREKYATRTLEAWRRGFNKIYCQSCHRAWLDNNPKQTYNKSSNGGCLSVLIIGLAPILIYAGEKIVS